MAYDVQILPDAEGLVTFDLIGKMEDCGLMLLQRLYALLLTESGTAYRTGNGSYTFLNFLEGGNYPSDGVMNSILAISCANAVKTLDEEDQALVAAFSGECVDGEITCTLELADGTTLKGIITNG